MRKNLWKVVICLAMTMVLATGCGSDSNSNNQAAEPVLEEQNADGGLVEMTETGEMTVPLYCD